MRGRNGRSSQGGEAARVRGIISRKGRDASRLRFKKKEGLTWIDAAGRTWTVTELRDWRGTRAQAGRLPPKDFPKSNSFGPKF